MKNRFLGCLILFVIGAGLVVGAYFAGNAFGRKYSAEISADKPRVMESVQPSVPDKAAGVPLSRGKITLYIPDEKQGEAAVRSVSAGLPDDPAGDKLTQSMVLLVKRLVRDGNLPPDTRLVGKVRVRNSVASVDFSEEIRGFSGSTLEEAQLANSLASTAVANGEGVQKIRILVCGSKVETLGGHLDLSEPFGPDLQ